MIPSDLAARLRMLAEASFFDSEPAPLQGSARVRAIQSDLPALQAGERYTAALQRSLPDGTFQAIIAGKTYTLALNSAASAGDTVELVVTKNTPNTVFAQLVTPPGPAVNESAAEARPNLSAVGRLIGFLLTGQPTAKPTELAGGQPLLDAPPVAGGETLAPVLKQAVSESGLFYESHQLQWISGKLPTVALLQEPQGQQPVPAQTAAPGQTGASSAADGLAMPRPGALAAALPLPPGETLEGRETTGAVSRTGEPYTRSGATPLRETDQLGGDVDQLSPASSAPLDAADSALRTDAANGGNTAARAAAVPERLMPVIHQQLDGMATQTYVWHGQVWPGQRMEWEVEDPRREREGAVGEDLPNEWKTTLRLTLPRLGGLEARLVLTPAGVAMRLLADDSETVAALDGARAQLDAALAAANVPLTGFVAERRHEG
ncbi:MAG TPA: flagellar hook-length control protein FliK [Aromatoleum sp.]|uniref:flagellar hook-length control protein FliK n=1 Tax=Aromatoleum sp. TaxID=2307007 RepID=UPI002B469455|nr:flagellar hook-length control protein FliK [Aromatoleum sp.]HJV26682.1 flagellar hook-length control protein FliK [Aromatoleum sp.]